MSEMRTSVSKNEDTRMPNSSEDYNSRGTKQFDDKKSGLTGARATARSRCIKKENDERSDSHSDESSDEEKGKKTSDSESQTSRDNTDGEIPPKSTHQDKKIERIKLKTSEDNKRTKFPREETAGHGLWAIFVYSTILLVAVLAVIIAPVVIPEELKPYILRKEFKENTKFDYVKIFEERLKEFKMQFSNQPLRFWTILEKRGLAHLKNKRPTQPLVILLGAPPSAHSVIDCIAWKLVQTLDPGNDDLGYIDGTRFTGYGPDEAKKIMDEKLERLFQKGDRSALILHLELLPPPSPFLFYSYCDNENAPFKEAAIIFTVHLPEEPDLSLLPAEQEGMIERYLAEKVWSKFDGQDGVSALLSRIADTVALVSGEAENTVKINCPIHLS